MTKPEDGLLEESFLSINLDRGSFVPLYHQIAIKCEASLRRIKKTASGKLSGSEGEVAERLAISKMTVRQAFEFSAGKDCW